MKKILKIFVIYILGIIFTSEIFAYSNNYFSIDVTRDYKLTEHNKQFPINYEFTNSDLKSIIIQIQQNPLGLTPERFTQKAINEVKKDFKKNLVEMEATYSNLETSAKKIGKEKYDTMYAGASIKILTESVYYNTYQIISDNYIYTIVTVSDNDSSLDAILNSFKINDTRTMTDKGLLWQDIKYFSPYIIITVIILFILIKIMSISLKNKRKNDKYNDIFNAINH